MKIGIIGATGKSGSLIAEEAYKRGHQITAIVRDGTKVQNKGFAVLEKDVFSLTAEDVKGFDAVVNAFGTPYGQGVEFQHQTVMLTLIHIMKELPNVRFLIVGGAGSLYTDETMTHTVLENIPEEYRAVPYHMGEAFKTLKASDVHNWTFFSPAGTFDPKGARTGQYTLGTDVAILNEQGESYISYADYAIAMVDEIEKGQFIGRRFTAVSPHVAPPEPEKEPEAPVFEGLSQYRGPMVYELAGQSFHLVMDHGEDLAIQFMSGNLLSWSPWGEAMKWEKYDCLKADDETYLVNFEVSDASPRTGMTLVLDLEQRLVTIVRAYQGTSRKYPNLVTNDIDFGYLDVPGMPVPKKRHGYTDDLIGKRIFWNYGAFGLTHVYFDSHYIRVGEAPGRAGSLMTYDERCNYIKVKKDIYLLSFLEDSLTYAGKTGNNMLILANISRLHDVGRSFGLGHTGAPENYMFAAIGSWNHDKDGVEERPSLYRV